MKPIYISRSELDKVADMMTYQEWLSYLKNDSFWNLFNLAFSGSIDREDLIEHAERYQFTSRSEGTGISLVAALIVTADKQQITFSPEEIKPSLHFLIRPYFERLLPLIKTPHFLKINDLANI